MSLGNILARLAVEVIKALAVGYVAGATGMSPAELAEQLRKAQGRNRSRSGPPVVFLQRVPKEGARS